MRYEPREGSKTAALIDFLRGQADYRATRTAACDAADLDSKNFIPTVKAACEYGWLGYDGTHVWLLAPALAVKPAERIPQSFPAQAALAKTDKPRDGERKPAAGGAAGGGLMIDVPAFLKDAKADLPPPAYAPVDYAVVLADLREKQRIVNNAIASIEALAA